LVKYRIEASGSQRITYTLAWDVEKMVFAIVYLKPSQGW
jgi:hypothetical protein